MQNSNPLNELFNLKGKTAIITGGAGYLGSEMTFALAEAGANVVIASRNLERCQEYAQQINDELQREAAIGLRLDVLDGNSIKACFQAVADQFQRFDILVNNAWAGKKNWLETISEEEWNFDVDMSLNSVFRCVREATSVLKVSGAGVIVNIASMYGHVSPDWRAYESENLANPPSYGAAKAGVIQFTRYLACYLARDGIRVNAISPGAYPFPETQQQLPDFMKELASRNPMHRIGEPWELKGVIVFLCSRASSYMTGQNLCVDGGWTVW